MNAETRDSQASLMRRRSDRARLRAVAMPLPTELIARRAYELFLERGARDGNDIDDWLRAEQELRARPNRGGD